MAIQDRQEKVLLIDFWLEPKWGKSELPSPRGNLRFENGTALCEAAAWLKMGIDEFLYMSIRDSLSEVQAAMGEEPRADEEGAER